ncbi:MAG: selenium metabolism-associated LysR family transcriptional regulator, partial [Defluviitaleaceae bacterium]|nr:selenium metabolism-associated LysR family transcriptional regulator [Defluviitaleaceae bacterium]
MDFKQLDAFVKVVELRSFSKAADAIFLSQPSVSNYIKLLEAELGAELINRHSKDISLTYAGNIFYEKAKELLALKQGTQNQIKSLSSDFKGHISILASSVPSQYILPQVLADFNKTYPDIWFSTRQVEAQKVVNGIELDLAEIGFCGGIVPSDKCDFFEFAKEQMVLIAPKQDGFCDKTHYSLDELLHNNNFVGRENGSGTKNEYDNYLASLGINIQKINIIASFDNTQSIINAVINGLGIAIVSEFAAKNYVEKQIVR